MRFLCSHATIRLTRELRRSKHMSTTATMPTSKSPTDPLRRLLVALVMAAAVAAMMLAVVMVVGARPAQAAYPGANGKIVFESDRTTGTGVDNPTGDFEIFTMNKDGTGLTQLTHNTASDYGPSFSADGSVVVFASDQVGNYEIYRMDSDGTDQRRLTNNTVPDENPTISPNGFTIAYESYRNGNREIIVQEGIYEANITNDSA